MEPRNNEIVSAGGKPLVPYILTPPFSFPSLVLSCTTSPRTPTPAPPKGRTVQLVVKINEFRYRLALFRSSCVTRAIPTSILDADISSTPRYNAALFDLRNRPGSWALYILLPPYVDSFYYPPGKLISAGLPLGEANTGDQALQLTLLLPAGHFDPVLLFLLMEIPFLHAPCPSPGVDNQWREEEGDNDFTTFYVQDTPYS